MYVPSPPSPALPPPSLVTLATLLTYLSPYPVYSSACLLPLLPSSPSFPRPPPPHAWLLQFSRIVCDDSGVPLTEQATDFTLQRDVHYLSPALERLSSSRPCGFGCGRASDLLSAMVNKRGAPVMRVAVTHLGWVGEGGDHSSMMYIMSVLEE